MRLEITVRPYKYSYDYGPTHHGEEFWAVESAKDLDNPDTLFLLSGDGPTPEAAIEKAIKNVKIWLEGQARELELKSRSITREIEI